MPEHEIAAAMGHSKKGNATKRYLHARDQRLARARQAMAAVRKQRSPGRPGVHRDICVHCGQLLPMSNDLEKSETVKPGEPTTSGSSEKM